jgi:hypothetical protein
MGKSLTVAFTDRAIVNFDRTNDDTTIYQRIYRKHFQLIYFLDEITIKLSQMLFHKSTKHDVNFGLLIENLFKNKV